MEIRIVMNTMALEMSTDSKFASSEEFVAEVGLGKLSK